MNLVKVAIVIAAVLGGGYILIKYIVGFNPLVLILETFGIGESTANVLVGIVIAGYVLYTVFQIMKATSSKLIFDGETLKFGGETYTKANIAKVIFKESPLFDTGWLIIDLTGTETERIEVQYISGAKKMCNRINSWLHGNINAADIAIVGNIEGTGEDVEAATEQMPKGAVLRGGVVHTERSTGLIDKATREAEREENSNNDVNFKHELIEYIKDQLSEGMGLEQIKQDLIDQGYEEEIIDFAINYVAKENKVSEADKKKKGPKTKSEHLNKKFHTPVAVIGVLIIGLIAIFFLFGPNGENEDDLPEEIDVFLYQSLGVHPNEYTIISEQQLYSRTELVDTVVAKSILSENKNNENIANLVFTKSAIGVQKTVTVYTLKKGSGSLEYRTLVKIRFSPEEDVSAISLIEAIPKSTATTGDILLEDGGMFIEEDPIIQWNFGITGADDARGLSYVVMKKVSDYETTTFFAKEKIKREVEIAVCGDGKCSAGESFRTCCNDCGCPQTFVCNGRECTSSEKSECNRDTDCDDGIKATIDKCEGKPKVCSNFYTTQCIAGDDYCPENCNNETDTDCLPEEPIEEEEETVTEGTINTIPEIHGILITPPEVSPGDTITIEAEIYDPNGAQDIDLVWAGIVELAEEFDTAEGEMFDDGLEESGDNEAEDGWYTIKLPINQTVEDGKYTVYIYVRDSTGNENSNTRGFEIG